MADEIPPHEETSEPVNTPKGVGADGEVKGTKHVEDGGDVVKKTARVGDDRGSRGVLLAELAPGDTLCEEFEVVTVLRQHERARAGLFVCRDGSGAGDVLVKVSPPAHPPDRPLWERLPNLDHPNIVRTLRVIEFDGLFCDVQEYYTGGSLADRRPTADEVCSDARADWLLERVIPQVFAGIGYLHGRGRVHRDIKPANIYIRNPGDEETYILADLDVSTEFASDGRTRLTADVALTDEFAAPEMFPLPGIDLSGPAQSMVTRRADFYSLGVTLLWLLCGQTPLAAAGLRQAMTFYLEGRRLEVPTGISEHLQTLLHGLLIRERAQRWDDDDVTRWMAGETTEADRKAIADDRGFTFVGTSKPYKLHDRVARDLPELALAMQESPDVAARDLLQKDFIVNWIAHIDSNVGREAAADQETLRGDPSLAVFAVGMLCDPDLPLFLEDGSSLAGLTEFIAGALAARGGAAAEAYVSDANLRRLEVWLRRRRVPENALADGVVAVRDFDAPPATKLEELLWRLDESRPFEIAPGAAADTPKQFARLVYGEASAWSAGIPAVYVIAFDLYTDGTLAAWLRARGLPELARQATELLDEQEGHGPAAFETTLRLLDVELPPVVVRLSETTLSKRFTVAFGDTGHREIAFETVGQGVPYAAVSLTGARAGLQVASPAEVAARSGVVTMQLDSRNDVPVSHEYSAGLALESGFTRLEQEQATVHYKVEFPAKRTAVRILVGAVLGALLLGVPRLVMALLGASGFVGNDPSWASEAVPDRWALYAEWVRHGGVPAGLWSRIQGGEYPFVALLGGILVLLVGLVVGWRVWRWLLRTRAEA